MNLEYMSSANEEKMFDLLNNLGNTQECFLSKSYVRFLNAISDSKGVDIYVDGIMVADNLEFGEFTSYLMVYPDKYTYQVFNTGTSVNPLVDTEVRIVKNSENTAAIVGTLTDTSSLGITLIVSQKDVIPPVKTAGIKFTNLCYGIKPLNLVIDDGTILYKDVAYKKSTPNIMLVPGTYGFRFVINGTNKEVIAIPDIELEKNTYYKMFALGNYAQNEEVEVVIPESGLNFLDIY